VGELPQSFECSGFKARTVEPDLCNHASPRLIALTFDFRDNVPDRLT
jgi:hypothetical protein